MTVSMEKVFINVNKWLALVLLLLVVLAVSSEGVVAAQSTCEDDVQGLIQQCAQYVMKSGPMTLPSKSCCGVIKKVNIPCACKHVDKDVEEIISMQKLVYVVRQCGRRIAHGTKCGSYTVPRQA